jgi:formate dehydrogenase subunit delta
MNPEYLTTMANEIGAFFAATPNREQAARDIAYHLKRFWDPRMRREIVAQYRKGGEGLDETVRRAIALLADETPPAA